MDIQAKKRALIEFCESRTGAGRLKEILLLEPIPGGSRWAAVFGSMLLFAFLIQVLTGILLATNYSAAADSAWSSVSFIQEQVPLGWFVRAVHHWAASAMVVLLVLHVVQVFVWGAYKRPRELIWLGGVLQLLCVLGLAFTGYLLRWDQNAYWATQVGLGIVGTTPLVGGSLRTLMAGGPQIGNLTLTRFFTLHGFVLPGLLIFLVAAHVYLFRLHGVTPHWGDSPEQLRTKREPFWPGQAWKDIVAAFVLLVGVGIGSFCWLAPIGAAADASRPYDARPEWYFMFLFQTLKLFQGSLELVGTFVLPTLFLSLLVLWPFLDRTPEKSPRRRPLAISLMALIAFGLAALEVYAIATDTRSPEQPAAVAKPSAPLAGPVQPAQVAALYRQHCSACHGGDGAGKAMRAGLPTIPDFTSLAWQISRSDHAIIKQIQEGKVPLMPGFQGMLQDQETAGLMVFVRGLAMPAPTSPVPAPAGGTLPAGSRGPLGQAGSPQLDPPAAASNNTPQPASPPGKAEQVFRETCVACHGADGHGVAMRVAMPAIPDFADAKWQQSRTDIQLQQSIVGGKGKLMLPMREKLGTLDPQRMVEFVRKFDALSVAKVEQIFKETCVACHGADGRGSTMRVAMPAIPDFTDAKWQQSRTDIQLRQSIVGGKGKLMLPMREKLGTLDPQRMVEHVRKFDVSGPSAPAKASPAPPAAPPASSPTSSAPERTDVLVGLPNRDSGTVAQVGSDTHTVFSPIAETAAKGEPAAVWEALFRKNCAICHGRTGKGTPMRDSMPTIPNFTDVRWQEQHTAAQLSASILLGKGTLMPAFSGKVNADEARGLAAYVQAFAPRAAAPLKIAGDPDERLRALKEEFNALSRQVEELSAQRSR